MHGKIIPSVGQKYVFLLNILHADVVVFLVYWKSSVKFYASCKGLQYKSKRSLLKMYVE